VPAVFVPACGDLVKLSFSRRPAFVVSPETYNRASSLALFCPITSRSTGYPFEVELPADGPVTGVILVDQLRSLDWRARRARPVGRVPASVIDEVLGRLASLVA